MPSSRFLRLSAATVTVTSLVVDVANALPSFGTKIPNGQNVPCPPNLLGDNSSGCTASGFCFGLGHPNCGGFQSEDKVEGNPPSILLSPFGEDWKANGFVWTKELCKLDSDGDGFTNGDELGDPCCVWTAGSTNVMLDSFDGFVPSHPGMKDSTPPVGFSFEKASLCGGVIDIVEDEPTSVDQYYNPGETRGSFEFRVKPYPIPIKTTTYVDFVFNIPEDTPDFFHVVFGEAIISQPDHLHHFVLHGCSSPIDPSQEGLPSDRAEEECTEIMIGAWAPGSDLFANDALDTGVILGRGLGIESILLNVHYTDGVYEDPETLTHRMATDGVRIHYTTDFRPFTARTKRLVWVPYGPPEMVIPPNESRYFVSKTCNVNTACRDIDDKTLKRVASFMGVTNNAAADMISDLSCSSIKAFCFLGGRIGSAIQQLCPVTCGLCDETVDGETNPRNPGSYRVTSINYHAHLLGREMYATLLSEAEDETSLIEQEQPQDVSAIQKQASVANALQSRMIARDMQSREFWDYNDQASIPLDYDIAVSDESDAAAPTIIHGMEVKPGDKIVVSCVYDSTSRTEPTEFGLSTYEEMCITAVHVTFETPPSLLEMSENEEEAAFATGVVDIFTDIKLRSFVCDSDNVNNTTDVYQGFLTEDEDARNIWFEHPIEESDMCTFPVENFVIVDSFMTGRSRNCPVEDDGEEAPVEDEEESWSSARKICHGFSSSDDFEFLEENIAGFTCKGGLYDQKDSNEEPLFVSEADCLEVGGGEDYVPYTCAGIEHWTLNEAKHYPGMTDQFLEYMRTEWWQPKCCRLQSDNETQSLSAARSADGIALLALLAAGTIIAMI